MKTWLFLLLLPARLYGQAILSEVMVNEPFDRAQLEWIEIYFGTDEPRGLDGIGLIVNDDIIAVDGRLVSPAAGYVILARQLLPANGSDCFEYYWGDSSGYWGDSPWEQYSAVDLDFSIPNGSGKIVLIDSLYNFRDSVVWAVAPDDGFSLEREDVIVPGQSWHQSSDSSGSTPGRANSPIDSVIDDDFTLSVAPRMITPNGDGHDDYIDIKYALRSETGISIAIFDDSGRRHCRLLDHSAARTGSLRWDGADDNNNLLRPGVYIVAVTLSGARSRSQLIPVVIAP